MGQMMQQPSGPQMMQQQSGPQMMQQPSGPQMMQQPSGPHMTQQPSGPQMVQHPSGSQMMQQPAGLQSQMMFPTMPALQGAQPSGSMPAEPMGQSMFGAPPMMPMSGVPQFGTNFMNPT